MAERLYYNQSSYDGNAGGGYGKSQKTPSLGTGLGSETIMGSSDTGIYPEPPDSECEEEDDFGFNTSSDIDKFVRMINKNPVSADPQGFWPRRDRSSLGHSSNRFDLGFLAEEFVNEEMTAMSGMVPFSARQLYPSGFSGPPVGTGGSNQAFRTTGNFKGIGTQYGTSRAPIDDHEDEEVGADTIQDILSLDDDTRAVLKQKLRIMRLLNRLDEIDSENPDAA